MSADYAEPCAEPFILPDPNAAQHRRDLLDALVGFRFRYYEPLPPRQSRTESRVEDLEFLLDSGAGQAEICSRLKVTPASLDRYLHRNNRSDLARWFRSEAS